MNQIQGWTTVRESYSCALEQGPLLGTARVSVCICVQKNVRAIREGILMGGQGVSHNGAVAGWFFTQAHFRDPKSQIAI